MAFGDVVQNQGVSSSSSTNETLSLDINTTQAAAVGSLLVAVLSLRIAPASFDTYTGWTLVASSDGTLIIARIATGNASDALTINWTTGRRSALTLTEYEGPWPATIGDTINSTTPVSNTDTDNTLTSSSGAATPSQDDGMALAVLGWWDQDEFVTAGLSIDNSFGNIQFRSGGTSRSVAAMASKVYTTAASENPEWTAASGDGNSSNRTAFICFFNETAGGGGPLTNVRQGANTPSAIYQGANTVDAIYQGSSLVWGS